MMPDHTLCFNGNSCSGGNYCKDNRHDRSERAGCKKLPLLLIVIGKTKNLRSFHDLEQLSVWYSSNRKAGIAECLFEDYLHHLDHVFEHQRRHVVMFVDNCGAQVKVEKLKAIRLESLPPNT
ncbi:unnamed protein product, partial [Ixodes hexagonus]